MTKNITKKTEDKDVLDKDVKNPTDEDVKSEQVDNEEVDNGVESEETTETEEVEIPEETEEQEESEEQEDTDDEDDSHTVEASYDAQTKTAIASTDVQDRHGEKINQEGWDLKHFKKNPVMLWAHDHNEISVGNARNIHIQRSGGNPKLVFTPDFHEATDTARALKTLYEDGRLNSFSVGFIPKEFDGKTATYEKQELLEISAVNVPANPEARTMAYKSLKKAGFEKDVAKNVTGLDEEPAEKLIDILKGALADEIQENEEMQQKFEKMEPIHDIFWAFMDVYYSEETEVEDFDKLVGELITELGKVVNTSEETDEKDVQGDQVLDKDSTKGKDDNNEAKAQENKETSAAPKDGQEKQARAKQSLSKVIAKASDKLLTEDSGASKDTKQLLKIVKRAADILNAEHKK